MSMINTIGELKDFLASTGINLSENQTGWFDVAGDGRSDYLPFRVTKSYLKTAVESDEPARSAMLRQAVPDIREFITMDYELSDPLGEKKYTPLARMVRRYPDRILVLVTDQCSMFCRHCFRRSFSGGRKGSLSAEELDAIIEYISGRDEISEVLLSGGDPLTLSVERITGIIKRIKTARPDMIIRLCSRIPVVEPSRITSTLASALSDFTGLWLVTHFNHPGELSEDSVQALTVLRKAGIPILNQTVLLKGINNDVETLGKLFRGLLQSGVKPYYLFQGDLAAGTSHLRVPLRESLELTTKLKTLVSGMAMPRFAVDLPGGGGKITLPSECNQITESGEYYIIKGPDNEEYRYPAD